MNRASFFFLLKLLLFFWVRYSECHFIVGFLFAFFLILPRSVAHHCAFFGYVLSRIDAGLMCASSVLMLLYMIRWRTNKDNDNDSPANNNAYVCICQCMSMFFFSRTFIRSSLYACTCARIYRSVYVCVCVCASVCFVQTDVVYVCMHVCDWDWKDQEPFFAGQWMTVQTLLLMDFELLTF